MITEKAYKLLYRYARKFAQRPQDIDDIFQESVELFIRRPAYGILPKAFFYTLARRGAYGFYFNANTGRLKNQEFLQDDYEEVCLKHPDEFNMENIVLLNEFRNRVRKIAVEKKSHTLALSYAEKELLDAILEDKELDIKSNVIGARRVTLTNKLKKFFA